MNSTIVERATQLGLLLQQRGLRVATAESCTGGLVAAAITAVAGSSAWFEYGWVVYSNEAKRTLLGVAADTLQRFGAVSHETVRELARNALLRADADLAVAVSGIAGPGGATAHKPVGTVCFGLATAAGTRAWTVRIPDLGRTFVRDRAVFEVWRALLAERT